MNRNIIISYIIDGSRKGAKFNYFVEYIKELSPSVPCFFDFYKTFCNGTPIQQFIFSGYFYSQDRIHHHSSKETYTNGVRRICFLLFRNTIYLLSTWTLLAFKESNFRCTITTKSGGFEWYPTKIVTAKRLL